MKTQSKKGRRPLPAKWGFHTDREVADRIRQHLRATGIKQREFFSAAALKYIELQTAKAA